VPQKSTFALLKKVLQKSTFALLKKVQQKSTFALSHFCTFALSHFCTFAALFLKVYIYIMTKTYKKGGKKSIKRHWSRKYKLSIDCKRPRGFSQRQHCKYGRGKTMKAGGKKGSIEGLAKLVIPKFLEMINTIKIYHWKTSSYSTHKATDQLFADLNTKTDEFVEVMLGKSEINRDKVLDFSSAKISSFKNNNECRNIVDQYKSFLLDLPKNKNFNVMANVDLLAIRDEILALLNQFLYLTTFVS